MKYQWKARHIIVDSNVTNTLKPHMLFNGLVGMNDNVRATIAIGAFREKPKVRPQQCKKMEKENSPSQENSLYFIKDGYESTSFLAPLCKNSMLLSVLG